MSSPFIPIESSNKTLAAHVSKRIRDAILTQALKPGARIDQNQIAASLNVSLAPVREALKGLEAEGFVTIFPRRGVFVTNTSIANLDELYFARALIEGETIYQAVPHLNPADLKRLQQLIERMKVTSGDADIKTYMTLNREFHLGIYSVLDNQTLIQIIQNLWERSELYRYRYMFIAHNPERVHREHQLILDACARCDQPGARDAAMKHIQLTQYELHEFLRVEIEKSNND